MIVSRPSPIVAFPTENEFVVILSRLQILISDFGMRISDLCIGDRNC